MPKFTMRRREVSGLVFQGPSNVEVPGLAGTTHDGGTLSRATYEISGFPTEGSTSVTPFMLRELPENNGVSVLVKSRISLA